MCKTLGSFTIDRHKSKVSEIPDHCLYFVRRHVYLYPHLTLCVDRGFFINPFLLRTCYLSDWEFNESISQIVLQTRCHYELFRNDCFSSKVFLSVSRFQSCPLVPIYRPLFLKLFHRYEIVESIIPQLIPDSSPEYLQTVLQVATETAIVTNHLTDFYLSLRSSHSLSYFHTSL